MEFQKEVKSGIKWNSLSMIGGSLLQFLQVVILARLLQPEDFGLFALTLVFIRFCQPLVEMGFGSAIVQKKGVGQVEVSTLYWMNIFLGFSFFLILYLCAPILANLAGERMLQTYLPVIAIGFLILPFGIQPQAFLQRHLIFKVLSLASLFSILTEFILSICFALLDYGVWSLVIGYLGKVIVHTILMILFGNGKMDFSPKFQFNYRASKALIRFGLYETGSLFTNLAAPGLTKLIISKFLGVGTLGIFTIIWDLVTLPYGKLNPVLTRVAFPTMSRLTGLKEKMGKWYQYLFKGILFINLPIYALLVSFPEEVLYFGLGEEWIAGAVCLRLMGIYGFFRGLMHPGATLLISLGKTNITFAWNLVWLVGSVFVLFVMLYYFPTLDAVGYAYLVSLILFYWVWLYIVNRFGNIKWSSQFLVFSKYVLLTIAIMVLIRYLYFNHFAKDFLFLAVAVTLYFGIYLFILIKFESHFFKKFGFGND